MGHPVYSRAAYATAESAAVCDLAETCARPCTRVRVYVWWRGLVAARLPASALGCAARQDIEPSATQPGDHPRVQAALYSSPARISRTPAYPGPSPQPAIFRSPFSTGNEKRGPHPSRKHSTSGPSYPPATHGLLSSSSGLIPNCSFTRTRANIFAGEQHARHAAVQMLAGPFYTRRTTRGWTIGRSENLELAFDHWKERKRKRKRENGRKRKRERISRAR